MNAMLGILAGICGALHFIQFDSAEPKTYVRMPFRLRDAGKTVQLMTLWGFVIYLISGYKPELRLQVTEAAFWLMCTALLLYKRALEKLFNLHIMVVRHYEPSVFEDKK